MAEDTAENTPVRLAFQIGYLGGGFAGSQFQPDQRTVEGEIGAACLRAGLIRDRQESRLSLAGRTDRGVHARTQILAFTTDHPGRAVRALNGQLPPDIWADRYAVVDEAFYPRFAVSNRTYRYYYDSFDGDPSLAAACRDLFLGRHDFTCFARLEPGKNPVRTIRDIRLYGDAAGWWLEISAESFLWHQVRCIAGALRLAAEGKITGDGIRVMLSGSCRNKVKPAPPDGLILWDADCDCSWIPLERSARTRAGLEKGIREHDLMARVYRHLAKKE